MSLGLAVSAQADDKAPIQVIIMSGQSNMVGMGRVTSGGSRWGDEFTNPVVSVYEGKYNPKADYDKMKPIKTVELENFGGTKPTPYPGGGVQITRGFFQPKETGIYKFKPGFGGSMNNIMEVDGQEVYRKEPDGEPAYKNARLNSDRKVPFKITYLTGDAGGLGWIERLDMPGSLSALVKYQGK